MIGKACSEPGTIVTDACGNIDLRYAAFSARTIPSRSLWKIATGHLSRPDAFSSSSAARRSVSRK